MKSSAALIIALLAAGCAKKTAPSVNTLESKRVTITPREVPVTIKADSSQAAFKLDVKPDGKIEANKIISVAGNRAAEPWVEVDTAGVLRVKCPCLEVTENVTVTDTKEETNKTTTITKVEYTNVLTGWQWFQVWTGRIVAGLIFLWLVFRQIKKRTIPK